MPKLSPEELNSRLRFDWNIVQRMKSPLATIAAFKSMNDLKASKHPITDAAEAHRAIAYLVEYRIKSLVDAGRFHDRFDVSIDLMAGGNYPYSEPACFVISRPVPWSPHFLPSAGSICLGELWSAAAGNITLGHLIIHIAKLLNSDEADREPGYSGWNAQAVQYWRHVMKRQPVTPGLQYPVVPPQITHGVTAETKPLFCPASAAAPSFAPAPSLFRPARTASFSVSQPTLFRPVGGK